MTLLLEISEDCRILRIDEYNKIVTIQYEDLITGDKISKVLESLN